MSQFDKKYKDRKPEETIELIQNFFKERNIDVNIVKINTTEAGTYYCHLELLFNNRKLLHANGKGMNKIFALASGYAEAYERFCNVYPILHNIAFERKYRELSKQKNGYMHKPNEKILSIEEMLKDDEVMNFYFEKSFRNNYEILNPLIAIQSDGEIIGTPFKNIANENDIRYFDHRIYNRVVGSKGFAAGNSTTEAINQGVSEMFECHCAELFVGQLQERYYEINIDKLDNDELKETHQKIINAGGYEVHYLDLSYNFNYPTVAGIVLDKNNNKMFIDFGAFPIFDIALERVITELYQGVQSFKSVHRLSLPYRGSIFNSVNSPLQYKIDERIFERLQLVDTFNKECYVQNTEASNEEILEFIINLINRDNCHIYYEENGLIDEIKAVSLYSPDFMVSELRLKRLILADDQDIVTSAIISLQLYQAIDLILNAKSSEEIPEEAIDILIQLSNYDIDNRLGDISGMMIFGDWLELYGLAEIHVLDILHNYDELVNQGYIINGQTLYKDQVRKYAMIQAFASNCHYSEEEKIKYLNLYGIKANTEDLSKAFDKAYIARKVIAEPFYEFYHSKEYEDLVSTYIH